MRRPDPVFETPAFSAGAQDVALPVHPANDGAFAFLSVGIRLPIWAEAMNTAPG